MYFLFFKKRFQYVLQSLKHIRADDREDDTLLSSSPSSTM